MFKKVTLAALFVGAMALGSLGMASQAEAGHPHRRNVGRYGPAPYPSYYAPRRHVRSVYYGGYHPRAYGYSAYYAAPVYPRHTYYRSSPSFRLSIGF